MAKKSSPKIEEVEDLTNVAPIVIPIEQAKALLAKPAPQAIISGLIKQSQKLSIKDENDKEGYQLVHKEWQTARQLRLDIEKARKQFTAPAVVYQREVNAYAKALIGLLEPAEKILGDKLEYIDNIVEEKKKEKERLIEEAFNKRVQLMYASGLTFDGSVYRFEDLIINPVDLRAWEDGFINNFLNTVKERKELREQETKEANEEQARIAKKNKELADENQKLIDQINAGKKAITNARAASLMELGFTKNITGQYSRENFCVLQQLLDSPEEEWQPAFMKLKLDVQYYIVQQEDKAARELAEKAERDVEAKKFRASQLKEDIDAIEFTLTTLLSLNLLDGSNDLTKALFRELKSNIDSMVSKLQAAQKEAYYKLPELTQ